MLAVCERYTHYLSDISSTEINESALEGSTNVLSK